MKKETNNLEDKISNFIRDVTKVGPMPKSEAKRRILELLAQTKEDCLAEVEERLKHNKATLIKEVEGMKKDTGPIPSATELASKRPPADPIDILKVGYNQAIKDILARLLCADDKF